MEVLEMLEDLKNELNESLDKLGNKGISVSLKPNKSWDFLKSLIEKFFDDYDYEAGHFYFNVKLPLPTPSGRFVVVEFDIYHSDYSIQDPKLLKNVYSPNNLKVPHLLISAVFDYEHFFSRKYIEAYFDTLLLLKKAGFDVCHDEVLKLQHYPFIELEIDESEYKLVEFLV
jgi:hypothetical protein